MNPVEWYYARDNQQSGPVSSAELKQLAAGGELGPDDLVWREEMPEWAPARNVRGLFDGSPAPAAPQTEPVAQAPAAPAVPTAPQEPAAPMRHPFDALIDGFRLRCDVGRIDSIARFFRACGSFGLLAAMLLVVVFSVLMTRQMNPISVIVSGVAVLVILAVLQYVAGKMCDALDRLNASTADSLPLDVFPRVLAVLGKALGVVVLLSAIAVAVQGSAYEALPFGVAAFLAFGFFSLAAMSPAALNVTIGAEAGLAEHALQMLTYVVKAAARTVPAAFGIGVLYGTFWLGYACYLLAFTDVNPLTIRITEVTAISYLVLAAILPLTAYAFFLLYYLLHDFCRKVLELPGKLNSLTEAKDQVDSSEKTQGS